jgi:hypothetical protein
MTANCPGGQVDSIDPRSGGKDSGGHRTAGGSVTTTIDRLPAIAYLQKNWDDLEDMDRANRIFNINYAGVSLSRLAVALNCSDHLLHHLLDVAKLEPVDWASVRRVEIRAKELARRREKPPVRRTGKQKKAAALEKSRPAEAWSNAIFQWLLKEHVFSSYAEQVIVEARSLLRNAEETGKFPAGQAPADMPTEEIIRRTLPSNLNPSEVSWVAPYAFWLAVWTCHAIPESAVRDRALDLAWEMAASS